MQKFFLIIGLILVRYLPQHQQEYFRYLNPSVRSDFNTTFAPKQPIQTGLAVLARANRLKVFEINSERSKKKNVIMKLLFSILLMSGDIQSNPGPCKYPCGICATPVKINQRGIQCDFCDVWHHIRYMNMDKITYKALANSSCVWECNKCGLLNHSSYFTQLMFWHWVFKSVHSLKQ